MPSTRMLLVCCIATAIAAVVNATGHRIPPVAIAIGLLIVSVVGRP